MLAAAPVLAFLWVRRWRGGGGDSGVGAGYGALLNLSLLVAWHVLAAAGTGLPRTDVGCTLVIVLTLPLALHTAPKRGHSEKDIPLNGIWSAPR
jgi:hypothetical protein